MVGSTNLTGTVPCALFSEHKLKTLMMSSNKLEGTLPSCVLEVSGNGLTTPYAGRSKLFCHSKL